MMIKLFLNTKELAQRWGMKPETLKQWRSMGKGPNFFKIGGRVAYRLEDIIKFEFERSKNNKNTL